VDDGAPRGAVPIRTERKFKMKLVECKIPERLNRVPKYKAYLPIVREFADTELDGARIDLEDGDEPMAVVRNRIDAAIKSMGGSDAVGVAVRTRQGNLYLERLG